MHTPRPRSDREPTQLLSVTTVPDPRPGRVVVEVVGEVDAYTAPAMDVCLTSQASRPGVRELVVYLGQVTFLGAAGVDVLAAADRRCRERGARLVIRTGGRRAALGPLQMSGLADLVAVDPAGTEPARPRGPRTPARPGTRTRPPSARRPRRVCR